MTQTPYENDFQDVLAFHRKFDLPTGGDVPTLLTDDLLGFRLKFLREEALEFMGASDIVETADALVDLVYVVHGTALFMGVSEASWIPPTFPQAKHHASIHNLRPGQTYPHVLRGVTEDILHRRLGFEINSFEHSHRGGKPNTALYHLYWIAHTAYLTAWQMQIPWRECWKAVHNANMSKVRAASDGSNSKRGSAWDVVKPADWVSPNEEIRRILRDAGAPC